MADTSVVAGASRADGSIPYELGKPNWQTRTIPDIRHPSSTIQIPESRLIDVMILGDGFQTSAEFEAGLRGWIDDFYDLKVYDTFQGAFRIRAVYRRSSQRASSSRDSSIASGRRGDDIVGSRSGGRPTMRTRGRSGSACSTTWIRLRTSTFGGARAA
jgi:hypothetical protein